MKSINKRSMLTVLLFTIAIVMGCFCISYAETPVNKVQVNKEYSFAELEADSSWGNYYAAFNVSDNGRIKVWVKDFNGTIDEYTYLYLSKTSENRDWRSNRCWVKNGDQMNSGWITVTPGEWEILIDDESCDDKSSLFIEYQSAAQYSGETENNNTFSTANPILSGQTYEGNFSSRGEDAIGSRIDIDYYKMSISESGMLAIDLVNKRFAENNVPFEVYRTDENGNRKLLLSVEDENLSFNKNVLTKYNIRVPKGEYFIKVLSDWKESSEYALKVDYHKEAATEYEQESNDSSRTANLIESGVKYIGNLNNAEDVDWFKVVLKEKGSINAELWIPEDVGTAAVEYILYDSDLKKMYSKVTENDVYYASEKKSVAAGTYYVCVKNAYNGLESTNNYRIRVNADITIDAVTNLKAVFEDYNKVKLTWTKSKGAAGYNVHTQKGKGLFVLRGYTEDGEFLIEDLAPGAKYTFVVEPCRAKDDPVMGALNTVSGYTLKKVVQNKVKRYSSSKVTVSWKDISGESGYEVCKMTKKNGVYSTVKTCKTTKSYINIKGKKGVKYYYKVRAYKKSGGKTVYAPWSSVKTYKL